MVLQHCLVGKHLFLMLALLRRTSFSNHLLWSIFQSSLHTYYELQSFTCWTSVGSFQVPHLHLNNHLPPITVLQPVVNQLIFLFIQNINHGPKRDLIHHSREKSIIRPLLYHQATQAGLVLHKFNECHLKTRLDKLKPLAKPKASLW